MSVQATDLVPAPDEVGEELLHRRDYEVEVYRHSPTVMRVHGALRDVKPHGLWLVVGEEPMTIHHMIVDLFVEVPSLRIVDVHAAMATRPNEECAHVLDDYQQLLGLSIVRGFGHEVKARFGGPRACTHVTILLQAMAPAAIQSLWSMLQPAEGETPVGVRRRPGPDERQAHFERNRNTCHVWADDGPMFERIQRGDDVPMPLWARDRLEQLGLDPAVWYGEEG